ncbi:iron chelate uptake ABC transporter family permease subunit [Proteiniclasticum ruminis]|uniref:Iron complex transport system permease protein n=1 Tax=Proteiniclasticum ruminis TaxID=398199 RepID=A0A1G8GGW7_9CLOT|nr:iron chelate uptake ABC transporter family permease subunit [Proteiniclasticum ruminis]SDH93591.1 iron complex transport system permease protein [Proteiniclasticum ruminis]
MKKKIAVLSILLLLGIGLFLFLGLNPNSYEYALSRRIPKILAITLTGGAIAYASLIFQTVTENRILTPSVLGLDSVFVFIQTIAIFFIGSEAIAKVDVRISFLFSVGIMVLFSVGILGGILRKVGGNIYLLLLVGIITGTLFRSASSFLQVIIDPNEFLTLQGRLFASFNNINTDVLLISAVLLIGAMVMGIMKAKELDVLSLGKDHAVNLGINHKKLVNSMLVLVAVLISVSTALVGPITFLGILVTNLSRELLKTFKHTYLLIGAMLISSTALVYGQLLVERIFVFSTPISVIINFIGGLYFIYLLLRENQL